MAALQGELDMPVVVHSIFADAVGEGTDLRAHGLASYERTEQATRALSALTTPPPLPAVPLPAPAAPLRGAPGYVEARALLLGAGIAYGDGGAVRTPTSRCARRRARALPGHAQGRRRTARAQVRPRRRARRPR